MKKADLNGPKDKSQKDAQTFMGEPEKKPESMLDHVKRKARERLQEVMGQVKENVVFEKGCKMEPGMSYAKLKEKEKKKD